MWKKAMFDAMIAAIIMANSTYVSVMSLSMKIWACYEDDGGKSVMIAAPQVACNIASSEYRVLIILSLFYCLLYIAGINVIASYTAHHNNRVLQAVKLDYKKDTDWWYDVINVYKFIAVLITTILPVFPGTQIPMMLAVVICMAVAVVAVQPHKSHKSIPDEDGPAYQKANPLDFVFSELVYFAQTGDLPNNLLELLLFAEQAIILFVLLLVYHDLAEVFAAGVVLIIFYLIGLLICLYTLTVKFKDLKLSSVKEYCKIVCESGVLNGVESEEEYGVKKLEMRTTNPLKKEEGVPL